MSYSNFNLLPLALGTLIPPTPFQYRQCNGRTTTEFGQVITSYTEWKDAYGIVQPAGKRNEHVEGMDLAKNRISVWIKGVELKVTHDQTTPDQVRYRGHIFNVVANDEWGPYDNFYHVECTEVDNLGEDQT